MGLTSTDANDHENENKQFVVPYSLDPQHFFRLQCSSCDREFKVLADAISMADSLAPAFKQIEREHDIHLSATSPETTEEESNEITCPYCGNSDLPANLNTREFIDHAVHWMKREFVYDLLNQFSRDLENIVNRSSRGSGGGFISLKLEYKRNTPPKPVRPISGPELPDMKQVNLLCCGKTIKIADAWGTTVFCPYCSQELVLQ